MEFKNEYLGYFHQDDDYEKAQLLWLWYDYHTEIFDRSLWSAKPSRNDESMVVLASSLAHAESNRNAMKIRNDMYEIAKSYNISHDVMHKAKTDNYRNSCKMKVRMDTYLKLYDLGKLNFINES
ncbi:hypothetical protein [Sporosarcina sp. FSL W7-1283]|uniref:hypothetical protein n=1 Tax=Sporosarcina sp. FSL W7-1283 TaxID=2921560 RepID=UPI0030F69512